MSLAKRSLGFESCRGKQIEHAISSDHKELNSIVIQAVLEIF